MAAQVVLVHLAQVRVLAGLPIIHFPPEEHSGNDQGTGMKKESSFSEDIYNFLVGFCMGGANVIPGVSGGTMLFIMGAFGKLTEAVAAIVSVETLKLIASANWKALGKRIPWRFLFFLGAGIVVSFATLAKLFVWLLREHPEPTFGFFFGLIAASIVSVNRQMRKWSLGAIASFLVSAAAAFCIISLVPVKTGCEWYMMMLYGAICIIAMILPGLSGSFLLLIFGQYDRIWSAVGELSHLHWHGGDIMMLTCLAAGAVLGLGIFVHLLNYLMKQFYNVTVAALIGFMAGAIPRLWPWQHENPFTGKAVYDAPACDDLLPWVILAAIAGLVLVLAADFLAGKRKTREE